MDFSRLARYPDGPSAGPAPARRTGFSPVDAAVETTVEVFLAGPHADEAALLTALGWRGIAARDAWRLHQFVPIAFTHVVLERSGVLFQSDYDTWDPDTGRRGRHRLRDEPLYVAGVRSARRWLARGYTPDQLLPVFGCSAEWDAIRKVMRPNGDMCGIVLCEPLLVEFPDGPPAEAAEPVVAPDPRRR
jgi:hypothetical protein